MIEPGHGHGAERRRLAASGVLGDRAPGRAGVVYLTPDRMTAAWFAHCYPRGDVYRVEALGPVEESWEDGVLDYTAGRAVVVAATARAVELTSGDVRRFLRQHHSRRQRDTETAARGDVNHSVEFWHGGAPGLAVGDWIEGGRGRGPGRAFDIAPHEHDRVYVTSDLWYAEKFAHQYPHGDVYRVRASGPLTRSWADGPESYTCERAEIVALHRRAVALSPSRLRQIDSRIEGAYVENAPQVLAWLTGGAQ